MSLITNKEFQEFIKFLVEKKVGLLDKRARTLVGKLYKRSDVLIGQKKFDPTLYRELVRELVYEEIRTIKELIKIACIPKLNFIEKPEE